MHKLFASGITRISTLLLLAAVLSWLSFMPASSAHAADQVVSDCGDNGGANQLRAKISAANSSGGGMITFTCGPSITLVGGVLPTITTNITLVGPMTISGNNASRIFVTDTTLTLNNSTISNGYITGDDGGAIHAGGTLNLIGSKFLNNTVDDGGSGGAIVAYGTLTSPIVNLRSTKPRTAARSFSNGVMPTHTSAAAISMTTRRRARPMAGAARSSCSTVRPRRLVPPRLISTKPAMVAQSISLAPAPR